MSAWVAMLPPRIERPSLDGDLAVDIAIIGAGFAGLAAARRLSQLDPRLGVAVLEAGVIGEGTAGRNSGFIIDVPHEVSSDDYGGDGLGHAARDLAIHRRAIELVTEMVDEFDWGHDIVDPCGKYNIALSAEGDRHVSAYAAQLKNLGESCQLLDAKETAALTGSAAFTSALFTPGTLMIQPAAFIRAFADALKDPVRIFERTPALSIEGGENGWLVKTPRGFVSARKIIMANNGHAQSFGFFQGRLLHVFTYASMTEEFDPSRLGGHRKWAATPASPMGTTMRRVQWQRGDRMLIRSRYTYNPSMTVGERDVSSAGALHDRKFSYRFPSLAGVKMEYRWAGAMALTWNSVPAFGELEPGIFAACGCNGLGASNATASGIAAAESVLGVNTPLTQIYASYAKPTALPPQPLTTIGAKVSLTVKEWRAGVE
ncbi:glycine/D-amino acid oxidase-like deaminating enzyme [Phyllobacterium brassicacearum]|nr:glycine/D-amino acid oxidase-like deaminating enzyme [Phyllobacterium brassicacearum]